MLAFKKAGMIMVDLSEIWPEWTVEKVLGTGSYGTVYKAVRYDYVKSEAAIKVISVPKTDEEADTLREEGLDAGQSRTYYREVVDGFVREIELLLKLRGLQNIVSVEDYKVVERKDRVGWEIYIRMELLTPLKSWLADKSMADGSLTEAEIVKLGTDLCSALEICEKNHIIHRDIKPENILVNENGDFKLGDFGVARNLESTDGSLSVQGAWPYMAPEVAMHQTYDARVDIYSLGLVLYQLLNKNKLPFLDTDKVINSPVERQKALNRRLSGDPLPKPKYGSEWLSGVVLKACSFQAGDRYQNASELKAALKGEKPPRRQTRAFAVALLTLLAAGAFLVWQYADSLFPPQPTTEVSSVPEATAPLPTDSATDTEPPQATEAALAAPSEQDLKDINSGIEYPRAEEYYPEYRYATVKAPGGYSVFGFGSADRMGSKIDVRDGERVKMLAERKGVACCIILSQDKARWISLDNLKPEDVTAPAAP